ncbi:MAG: EVE domain-containing protein [Alphaproteobacteria bacterium]|nr:EVE domain-containing protein [Alphaproteobacteria bacterium]
MAYWLLKSEPFKYSWAQLVKDKRTHWDGVRNHQAAANLRAMRRGEECFFYHSNEGLEIVGVCEVAREAYPDPSDETGKFVLVDIKPKRVVARPVSLAAIKQDKRLAEFALVRQSRLSVVPVRDAEWRILEAMGAAA